MSLTKQNPLKRPTSHTHRYRHTFITLNRKVIELNYPLQLHIIIERGGDFYFHFFFLVSLSMLLLLLLLLFHDGPIELKMPLCLVSSYILIDYILHSYIRQFCFMSRLVLFLLLLLLLYILLFGWLDCSYTPSPCDLSYSLSVVFLPRSLTILVEFKAKKKPTDERKKKEKKNKTAK